MTWGLVAVYEFADVERVRQIRNTCREYMTRDTHEISEQEQLHWWCARKPDLRLFLFRLGDKDVGYGLTREEEGALVVSGGLLPDYRGFGVGHALFRLLVLTGHPRGRYTCRLEVQEDNLPARTVYEAIGFREMRHEDHVITMELTL